MPQVIAIITETLLERIRERAEQERRSVSNTVALILEDALNEKEAEAKQPA